MGRSSSWSSLPQISPTQITTATLNLRSSALAASKWHRVYVWLHQQRFFDASAQVGFGWLFWFGDNADSYKDVCRFEDFPCFFSYLAIRIQRSKVVVIVQFLAGWDILGTLVYCEKTAVDLISQFTWYPQECWIVLIGFGYGA